MCKHLKLLRFVRPWQNIHKGRPGHQRGEVKHVQLVEEKGARRERERERERERKPHRHRAQLPRAYFCAAKATLTRTPEWSSAVAIDACSLSD